MSENEKYLKEQLITYLGNKRSLIDDIDKEVEIISKKLGKDKLVIMDLFTGSGVVARSLKQRASTMIANDLEGYSFLISECYLTNKEDFNKSTYDRLLSLIKKELDKGLITTGIFYKNYAPQDDKNIKEGERVFFTTRNAQYIDSVLAAIDKLEADKDPDIAEYKKFFIAPLLSEISIKANTAGVFKGFYKNTATGKGQYGGNAENALMRILADIKINKPVFSNYTCNVESYKKDANDLVKERKGIDVTYMDPPYNQHPYGSNYFMLNIAVDNKEPEKISKVAGIPKNWNRSDYNNKERSIKMIKDLMDNIDSTYVIMSYSSDGFIEKDVLIELLNTYDERGEIEVREIHYNTYRASKNLKNRDIHIKEYLFIIKTERGA